MEATVAIFHAELQIERREPQRACWMSAPAGCVHHCGDDFDQGRRSYGGYPTRASDIETSPEQDE